MVKRNIWANPIITPPLPELFPGKGSKRLLDLLAIRDSCDRWHRLYNSQSNTDKNSLYQYTQYKDILQLCAMYNDSFQPAYYNQTLQFKEVDTIISSLDAAASEELIGALSLSLYRHLPDIKAGRTISDVDSILWTNENITKILRGFNRASHPLREAILQLLDETIKCPITADNFGIVATAAVYHKSLYHLIHDNCKAGTEYEAYNASSPTLFDRILLQQNNNSTSDFFKQIKILTTLYIEGLAFDRNKTYHPLVAELYNRQDFEQEFQRLDEDVLDKIVRLAMLSLARYVQRERDPDEQQLAIIAKTTQQLTDLRVSNGVTDKIAFLDYTASIVVLHNKLISLEKHEITDVTPKKQAVGIRAQKLQEFLADAEILGSSFAQATKDEIRRYIEQIEQMKSYLQNNPHYSMDAQKQKLNYMYEGIVNRIHQLEPETLTAEFLENNLSKESRRWPVVEKLFQVAKQFDRNTLEFRDVINNTQRDGHD